MNPVVLALVALALTASVPARAAQRVQAPGSPPSETVTPPPEPESPPSEPESSPSEPESPLSETVGAEKESGTGRSEAATRVADWIGASQDNGALPYIIIDKNAAALFLFDAKGKALGEAPVLIGVGIGDDATPGVGSKSLAEIGPAERTTPAGRFLAKFGLAVGKQRVLWVDYGTSVALHPVPTGNKKERRRARLLSPTSEDNRITFGCINVPLAFYSGKVRPIFRRKGGVVYILPDTKPIEDVFPRLHVQPGLFQPPQALQITAAP